MSLSNAHDSEVGFLSCSEVCLLGKERLDLLEELLFDGVWDESAAPGGDLCDQVVNGDVLGALLADHLATLVLQQVVPVALGQSLLQQRLQPVLLADLDQLLVDGVLHLRLGLLGRHGCGGVGVAGWYAGTGAGGSRSTLSGH